MQGTITIPAIHTCDFMHDHGNGFCELQWSKTDPLAVHGTALSKFGVALLMKYPTHNPYFTIARDVVYAGVRSGKSLGCPVVGEGEVTLKVMRQSLTTLSIRWCAGYIMLVDRDILSAWIDETYTIVGVQAEDKIIDMDTILQRILEGGEPK